MKITFTVSCWREYAEWAETDPAMVRKINGLIKECVRHPFKGTGKPEPLKQELQGCWSRRIDREHRLVYKISGSGDAQVLIIAQCMYHYEKRSQ